MKKEDLTALGIADDVADKIFAIHGKDIEAHKSKLTAAQTEADALKKQLEEAGATIEGFKKLNPEQLQAAVEEWKGKAEQAQKDAEAQVAQIKFDVALKESLGEWKVKDPADVIPHLKRDMLKLGEDGKVIGLKEQVEPLKTAKGYLFSDTKEPPEIIAGGQGQPINTDAVVTAMRTAAGLKP